MIFVILGNLTGFVEWKALQLFFLFLRFLPDFPCLRSRPRFDPIVHLILLIGAVTASDRELYPTESKSGFTHSSTDLENVDIITKANTVRH